MAKVTDPDTSKALQKRSGSQVDKLALLKKMQRKVSHPGLVQMIFAVTPETKAKLEALARGSGMSLSQTAGIILEAQMTKHQKLEEEIRRTVSEAMQEEFGHLEEKLARMNTPTEKLNSLLGKLFPHIKSTMKKGGTN
jgi:hypothetical protein